MKPVSKGVDYITDIFLAVARQNSRTHKIEGIGHKSLSFLLRSARKNLSVRDPASPVASQHGCGLQFPPRAKQFARSISTEI